MLTQYPCLLQNKIERIIYDKENDGFEIRAKFSSVLSAKCYIIIIYNKRRLIYVNNMIS